RRSCAAAVLPSLLFLLSGCAGLRNGTTGALPYASGSTAKFELPADAAPLGAFLRGQVALTRNDTETALKAFEEAVAADPDTPFLRLRLAGLLVRSGQLERALEQVSLVVEAEPNDT